jgi:hypothetical protein
MKALRLDIAVHQRRLAGLPRREAGAPGWMVALLLAGLGLGLMLWLG